MASECPQGSSEGNARTADLTASAGGEQELHPGARGSPAVMPCGQPLGGVASGVARPATGEHSSRSPCRILLNACGKRISNLLPKTQFPVFTVMVV